LTCASTGAGNRTVGLEDTEDLVSGNNCENVSMRISKDFNVAELTLGLGDTVRVTEDFTDLGGSGTLLRELLDLLDDLLGSGLEPRRWVAGVRDGGG
jgi:hypothetical protein